MDKVGMIAVRPLSELIGGSNVKVENVKVESVQAEPETIEIAEISQKFKKRKNAATTTKKSRIHNNIIPPDNNETKTTSKTENKKPRKNRREPLPGQLRIDSFYNSAAKTYKIEPKKEEFSVFSGSPCKKRRTPKKPKRRKKEPTPEDKSTTTSDGDFVISTRITRRSNLKLECVIDLCSENEAEENREVLPNNEFAESKNGRSESRIGVEIELDTTMVSVEQKVLPPKTTKKDKEQIVAKLETAEKPNSAKRKSPTKRNATSNCDRKPKTANKDLEDTLLPSSQDTFIESKPIARRSSTRKGSKKLEEKPTLNETKKPSVETNCSKPKWIQKKKHEQIPTPPTETSTVETKQNLVKLRAGDQCSRITVPTNRSILSPSDSNTSLNEKSASSKALSSKNADSTKLPTPPQSLRQSPLVADEMSLEMTEIFDEEQEALGIKKPSKGLKGGKLDFKIEESKPKRTRRVHPLPPYKVVEGTSFAVDAFRYGDIKDVTHYFLTHFHADHYIGLTKNFAYPVYMSSITAALIRVFIPLDEEFIKEIALNEPIVVRDVEVTAIDANHCPGAIMLIFKTRSGRCTLHTGDFRASAQMESEPIFWNNDIHTIYLDTTYFPKKYAFCHQEESIERAMHFVREFREKNVGTRILYVCGSYLVGKEKFWAAIARELSFKVWMDSNRRKAQIAIKDEKILSLLVDDPCSAQLHIIPIVHLNYYSLLEYIEKYSAFDLIFALRPSGWEKDSRPQFRGKVNIVGIEYSEHSSHDELKRFVQYLKPQKVISTVPVARNPMQTPKIPDNWYRYNKLTGVQREFQPAITSFFQLRGGQEAPSVAPRPPPPPQGPPLVEKAESGHRNDVNSSPVPGGSRGLINEMFISPMLADEEEEDKKPEEKPPILNASEEDDWLS